MTAADMERFTAALRAVAMVCTPPRRLDAEIVGVYFRALEDLALEPLERACRDFVRTAETGRRFPTPRELREWVTRRGTPAPGLSDDEHQRVWLRVARDMEAWRRDQHTGSAWPAFEIAWHVGLIAEGLTKRARPTLDRQRCWHRWLSHGSETEPGPLASRAEVEAIYRAVAPRCSPLFAEALRDIADRIHRARPAEDGGEER